MTIANVSTYDGKSPYLRKCIVKYITSDSSLHKLQRQFWQFIVCGVTLIFLNIGYEVMTDFVST
jgi:hypothetical protein